ncbi:hypothetical protein K1719_023918 [Acacia pycnantha]|nr:hypothetical protein K1719_023918 [Acacia pycnantha]
MSLHIVSGVTMESLWASGRTSEKLSLPSLQSKMKCDPEGYVSELVLLYNQFNSSLELFQQQAAMSFTSISGIGIDSSVAKDLGDRAMFLAHVTPFYPAHLADFPKKLADLLRSTGSTLLSGLRCNLTQALILLVNKQIVDIGETLPLFMDLQTLGDKTLRKLAFDHVVHSIRRMNQKHKNEAKNRALQNVLFGMLQQEDVARAKQSLITLCELHRRKIWFDDRTANAICTASLHPSSRIMIAALSFLLDYEKIENDEDSDDSSSEDESSAKPQVLINKESIYKANHKGTVASKKKKKAKLQRVMRSLKKQQRMSSGDKNTSSSPLNHLKDAQGFAEKLFSRLQNCNERFEVRMMMLKVITRTVGLHRLILLNLYPFLQKYVQPHQRNVTNLLAAAVQASHDMVPPDAVEPLFKQIVNQFVHDRSRPEAITVGLNVVRELCMRMPLLMTEELLQDLALYKKSHDKSISNASRSLIALFREVCPSLLIKKDRGRSVDPKARPKAYGEVSVATDVPGLELLQTLDSDNEQEGDDSDDSMVIGSRNDEENANGNEEDLVTGDDVGNEDDADDSDVGSENDDNDTEDEEDNLEGNEQVDEEDGEGMEHDDSDLNTSSDAELHASSDGDSHSSGDDDEGIDRKCNSSQPSGKKRKFTGFGEQLNVGDESLRALKKLAKTDGILSNDDFKKIKELKAKKETKNALAQHGFTKSASSDQLGLKPVDPAKLEVHVRKKLSKDERLALIRAGREDRGKYMARTAVKQKKTGGTSNRQKEHKKNMPLAAKRSKAVKSRIEKKKKQNRSGKQFRGRKAWK